MQYKLGLIGYPLGHSLSPWIHEAFLRDAELSGSYEKYEIAPEDSLEMMIKHFIENGMKGFNITVPYKETIIPYLDDIEGKASKMGAVNTVLIHDGKLKGYNTDGEGYVRSLVTAFPEVESDKDKRILLIGAGGAARGIYCALSEAGYRFIDIGNRTIQTAENIKQLANEGTTTNLLTLTEAGHKASDYDVLIQTTSVGMEPNENASILNLDRLKLGAIASDIVYKPLDTKFLKDAKRLGARIHHGHTMLLYQAQLAFEIWTGKRVPADELALQMKKILEGAS